MAQSFRYEETAMSVVTTTQIDSMHSGADNRVSVGLDLVRPDYGSVNQVDAPAHRRFVEAVGPAPRLVGFADRYALETGQVPTLTW